MIVTRQTTGSRAAMTMLEVIVSLTILVSLGGLVATWTRTAAQTHAHMQATHRQTRGIDRVLDLIGRDLACGDFGATTTVERGQDRIVTTDHELTIVTRGTPQDGGGPTKHVYRWDPIDGSLELRVEPTDHGLRARATTHRLLDDVANVRFTVDSLGDERREILTVTIAHDGRPAPATRRFRLW